MVDTVRWGIVTAGMISHDICNAFNSYKHKGDIVLAGIAARDSKKAAEFAKLHKIPKVFETYEAMAKSKDIGKLVQAMSFCQEESNIAYSTEIVHVPDFGDYLRSTKIHTNFTFLLF